MINISGYFLSSVHDKRPKHSNSLWMIPQRWSVLNMAYGLVAYIESKALG